MRHTLFYKLAAGAWAIAGLIAPAMAGEGGGIVFSQDPATGAIRELRARKAYVKPSVKRREEIKKAIYVQHLKLTDEQ